MDTYALQVYSYELKCVKCVDYQYNWLKYLAAVFLPLTIVYILVALFSISFTSPLLSGVVLFFQMAANPTHIYVLFSLVDEGAIIFPKKLVMIVISIADLWNLDFFRVYYSFCLHPGASPMMIMALDYVTAVYPLFLIGITYVLGITSLGMEVVCNDTKATQKAVERHNFTGGCVCLFHLPLF